VKVFVAAVAILDEIEKPAHPNMRITVAYRAAANAH
jgi:putative NADH-flavin reductase